MPILSAYESVIYVKDVYDSHKILYNETLTIPVHGIYTIGFHDHRLLVRTNYFKAGRTFLAFDIRFIIRKPGEHHVAIQRKEES